jgi:hypothetical protein
MPFFEGEHGSPEKPEIALEEILAQHLVNALVLHLFARGEEETKKVLLSLVVERQQRLVGYVLALVLGGALERDVGSCLFSQ